MRKFVISTLCLMFLWPTLTSARIGPEYPAYLKNLSPGVDYVPGEVIVKLIPSLENANAAEILQEYHVGLLQEFPKLHWQVLAVPDGRVNAVPELIAKLQEDPRVAYVTPNYYRRIEWAPNDYYWTQGHLWNFDVIGMPEAWDLDTTEPLYGGDPDIVVAVIDSGAAYKTWDDTEHYDQVVHFGQIPDLENLNVWINEDEIPENGIDDDANGYIDDREGWNFTFDSPYPSDDNEHGTHVTGTIAQSTNNDPGGEENDRSAAGMAFNSTVMILKTTNRDGVSDMRNVAEAIMYAADNGADVINMSLGSGYVGMYPPNSVEYDACQYAYDHDVVVLSSSGNDGDSPTWNGKFFGVGYPAGYPSVIAVGASNNASTYGDPTTETRSNFSQYGVTIEVIAPSGQYDSGDMDGSGKEDLTWQQTIKPRRYPDMTQYRIKGFAGTSMSCPHVAAQASLILAYAKQMGWDFSVKDVRNRIDATAVDINASERAGYDYYDGFGRINVPASMTTDPEPELVVRRATVIEGDGQGNGNHRPEAGETATLQLEIMSLFNDSTGVEATVSTSSPYVTIVNSHVTYPTIMSQETALPTTPITIQIQNNCPIQHVAEFTAVLTSNERKDSVTKVFHAQLTKAALLFWKDDRYQSKMLHAEEPLLNALDSAGIHYEIWDTTPKADPDTTEQFSYPWEEWEFYNFPTYEDFMQYDAVIWFVSQTGKAQRELVEKILPEIMEYLDHGGNMLITGHELLYNLVRPKPMGADDFVIIRSDATANPDDRDEFSHYFVYNYLHLKAVEHDNWYDHVYGGAADPLTRGITQDLDLMYYNTKKEYNWWPDNLVPREDCVVSTMSGPPVRPSDSYPGEQGSFDSDQPFKAAAKCCGLRWSGQGQYADYRLAFYSFPLEAMPNPGELLNPVTRWLMDGSGETSSGILVDIETSQSAYTYNTDLDEPFGDEFSLYGMVFNPGADTSAQRWVLLQIYDNFWCWPTWVDLNEAVDYENVTIPGGFSHDNFLTFEWPAGDFGTFNDMIFWFAHLTPAGDALLGEYDFCQCGYFYTPPS